MAVDNAKGTTLAPNYGKQSFKEKFLRRLRNEFVKRIQDTPFMFKSYPSYWHYFFNKNSLKLDEISGATDQYLTQKPDYGAGIGHQMANWNSGLYFSGLFGLKYAHTPFSSPKWENFFGFGEHEVSADSLIDLAEFKKVRLPRFDSRSEKHIDLIRLIIRSYAGEKVLFQFEINQGYSRQSDTSPILQQKFFQADGRKNDHLIFDKSSFNIALHIRRRMAIETDEMWKDRGLDNSYFSKVLDRTLATIQTSKKIEIYLFSQGSEADFPEFQKFDNLHFCMDMNPYDSFLHMVYADLLISSKSSFSYKPALISKGLKICPSSFWHTYPSTSDYILATNDGDFNTEQLNLKSKNI